MLSVLFKKKNAEENYLSVTPTDPTETRLGFLKLIQALFHHRKEESSDSLSVIPFDSIPAGKCPWALENNS
jgi:hypothetical protein